MSSERVHPSQIDFAVKDTLNGLGQVGLNLSDVIAQRAPRVPGTASELPLVGSLVSRFERGTGGQQRTDLTAADAMLAPDIRLQLRALGGPTKDYEPSPVPSEIQKVPLRQEEQTEYQRRTNQYFDQQLRRYMENPAFTDNDLTRQKMIDQAMTTARGRAQADVLDQIRQSGSNLADRRNQKSSAA
jgi:hypothetical protein